MNRRNVLVLGAAAFSPRIGSIATVAKRNGWNLFIDRLSRCQEGGVGFDGAIALLTWNPAELRLARRLVRRGVPVVDLACIRTAICLPRVIGDHRAIGRCAAEHFSAQGFRNAVWFASDWSATHRLRFDGFRSAFRGKTEKWIWGDACKAAAGRHAASLHGWLGDRLEAAPKPLAVATYEDADAACVLAACLKRRIFVPEEVAICGVDDDRDICENQQIPLSSVRHSQSGLALRGALRLQALMDGDDDGLEPVLVPPAGIAVRLSSDTLAVSDPRLRKAMGFLRDNLDKPLGLVQVADALKTSASTVKRIFADGLAQGLPQTLKRIRLHEAQRLLAETGLPIAEIAGRCGFCNASYLTNTFRDAFGVTPGRWRRTPRSLCLFPERAPPVEGAEGLRPPS